MAEKKSQTYVRRRKEKRGVEKISGGESTGEREVGGR